MRMTDLPMQRTYSEWLAYRDAGGRATCQSCHMPGGDHTMRGAHDVELLRGSLAVTASDDARGAQLTLASVGVGHAFPTGDLFRHLTVEVRPAGDPRVRDGEDAWRVVDRMGRTFETRLDGRTLQAYKVETADTVLVPGVPRVVRLPSTRGELLWRVRYHYGSERDERRGLVPADALFVTLASGIVPGALVPEAKPEPALFGAIGHTQNDEAYSIGRHRGSGRAATDGRLRCDGALGEAAHRQRAVESEL